MSQCLSLPVTLMLKDTAKLFHHTESIDQKHTFAIHYGISLKKAAYQTLFALQKKSYHVIRLVQESQSTRATHREPMLS